MSDHTRRCVSCGFFINTVDFGDMALTYGSEIYCQRCAKAKTTKILDTFTLDLGPEIDTDWCFDDDEVIHDDNSVYAS